MASTKPVIVLVPGAFHRPSSWDLVASRLSGRGFTVLTPSLAVCGDASSARELAGRAAPDDVAAIHAALLPLLDEGREAVVVSHSYGSVPASVAVQRQTVDERAAKGLRGGIKAIVTIAGFAYPVPGKSVMGDENPPPLMPYHVLEDGVVHLQESAKPLWYSDLSAEGQDAAWEDLHKAQSRASFCYFPSFTTAEIKVPKIYVLCEEDKAVEPQYQEYFIGVGKYDDVVRLPSGHAPLLSMPDRVVEIVVDAAGR